MLSAGAGHVVAINNEGSLFTWGRNNYGQLGNGSGDTSQKIPKEAIPSVKFKYVTTGQYRTFAISTAGQLYGCGQSALNGSIYVKNFQLIGSDTDWKSVYSASGHSLAIKSNGTLWGYGRQFDGGLAPMQIGNDNDWKTVAMGNAYTIALKTNGTMWSWGKNNTDGILGNGTTIDNSSPTQIGIDNNWTNISTDNGHVLALKTDGTLWGWGTNLSYELGNGTKIPSLIPIQIGTDSDWAFVNAESRYSIAIKSNGTIWIWGTSGYINIMGNGTYNGVNQLPTQIGTAAN
jgi:alpha-tubulin suppressor-like RCC1 family protein